MLLAQCVNTADCELPRSLPWWFTVALVVAWLALVGAIVQLARWRRRAGAARRPSVTPPPPCDDEWDDRAALEAGNGRGPGRGLESGSGPGPEAGPDGRALPALPDTPALPALPPAGGVSSGPGAREGGG